MNVINGIFRASSGLVGYILGLTYSLLVTVALCFLAVYVGKSLTSAVIFVVAMLIISSSPSLQKAIGSMLPNLSGWFSGALVAVCYIASLVFEAMATM